MEIKARLNKPYTENERMNFIVQQNHQNGYEIKETTEAIEAWGYTEEEKKQKEREELDKLSLTKREVFLALYKDKGITPEAIRAQITDPAALIEFDYANDYFRGNPLIEQIGLALGYTGEDLDYLFKNGELPPYYTLTIEATPKTADIVLTCEGFEQEGNSIKVRANRLVGYEVSAEGYAPQGGTLIVNEDITLYEELQALEEAAGDEEEE